MIPSPDEKAEARNGEREFAVAEPDGAWLMVPLIRIVSLFYLECKVIYLNTPPYSPFLVLLFKNLNTIFNANIR